MPEEKVKSHDEIESQSLPCYIDNKGTTVHRGGCGQCPAADAGPRQFTNRHGEPCSQACGEGRHEECTETYETCRCTYRGEHTNMHLYATAPPVPQEVAPECKRWNHIQTWRPDSDSEYEHQPTDPHIKGQSCGCDPTATAPDSAMRVAERIYEATEKVIITEEPLWFVRKTLLPAQMAALIREAGSEREREAFESCAKELREHYNTDWDSTVPGAEFDAEILRILRKHLGRAGGE